MNARFLGGLTLLCVSVAPVDAQTETSAKAVLYARATGYLEKVHVKPGAVVKKNDLLYEIDSAVYRAELAQVSAEMAVAEARLQQYAAQFERMKRLFELKVVAREEFDKIAADRTIAQASIDVVRARLDLAKLRLDFTKIHAPIDGTIQRPLQDIGSLVKADETVLAEIVQGPIKPSANIRALQKERHAILAKAANVMSAQHKAGRVPTTAVLQAQRAALDAALELCDTPAERVELLRTDVKLAEQLLKTIEILHEAGNISETELLQGRAAVLEVRIRLLREQEKAAPQKQP